MEGATVFVVQHVARKDQDDEDVKFIGVYVNRDDAIAAVNRLKSQPGFRDFPDGFHVEEYCLGEDHWIDGFGPA